MLCFYHIYRELQREQVAAEEALRAPAASKDYSLKQGEKIRIKINTTRKSKATEDDDDREAEGGFDMPAKAKAANSGSGDADLLGFGSSSAPYVLPLDRRCTPLHQPLTRLVGVCSRQASTSSWETF